MLQELGLQVLVVLLRRRWVCSHCSFSLFLLLLEEQPRPDARVPRLLSRSQSIDCIVIDSESDDDDVIVCDVPKKASYNSCALVASHTLNTRFLTTGTNSTDARPDASSSSSFFDSSILLFTQTLQRFSSSVVTSSCCTTQAIPLGSGGARRRRTLIKQGASFSNALSGGRTRRADELTLPRATGTQTFNLSLVPNSYYGKFASPTTTITRSTPTSTTTFALRPSQARSSSSRTEASHHLHHYRPPALRLFSRHRSRCSRRRTLDTTTRSFAFAGADRPRSTSSSSSRTTSFLSLEANTKRTPSSLKEAQHLSRLYSFFPSSLSFTISRLVRL